MKSSALLRMALGCALWATASLALGADAAPVKVFDATQLTQDRYTVVTRIWTQSWRSAFWVPEYDKDGWGAGYFCYGLAIQLK